jgi:hypothetical protein
VILQGKKEKEKENKRRKGGIDDDVSLSFMSLFLCCKLLSFKVWNDASLLSSMSSLFVIIFPYSKVECSSRQTLNPKP